MYTEAVLKYLFTKAGSKLIRECAMRQYLMIRLQTILDYAIHEHRVLWGMDADDEPLTLRDDIKHQMQVAGYTQEMVDDQLESAVWTWRFIHDRVKRITGDFP